MINPHAVSTTDSKAAASLILDAALGNQHTQNSLEFLQLPSTTVQAHATGTGCLKSSAQSAISETSSSNLHTSFSQQRELNLPYLVGHVHEGSLVSANFDYVCNPAAAEGEALVCEMVRKFTGLNEAYSIRAKGLGKMAPVLNEIILVCYHSTIYCQPREAEPKLVFYSTGLNLEDIAAPLILRNNMHSRQIPSKDSEDRWVDVNKLEECLIADLKVGLVPHFVHFAVRNLEDLSFENLSKLYDLVRDYHLRLMIDLSEVGIQVMQEKALENVVADFVVIDLRQFAGGSSHMFFIQDRFVFRERLINGPQEFLKSFARLTRGITVVSKEDANKTSSQEFNGTDYGIGFSNWVGWERLLILLKAIGKKGIRKHVLLQQKNLETLADLARQQPWVKSVSKCSFYIQIVTSVKNPQAKVFQENGTFIRTVVEGLGQQRFEVLRQHPTGTLSLKFYVSSTVPLESAQTVKILKSLGEHLDS